MYSGSYPIRMGAMFLVPELLDKVRRGELEEAVWEELSPGEQFVRAFAMLQQNLGKSAGFKMWSELGETMARWAAGAGVRGSAACVPCGCCLAGNVLLRWVHELIAIVCSPHLAFGLPPRPVYGARSCIRCPLLTDARTCRCPAPAPHMTLASCPQ